MTRIGSFFARIGIPCATYETGQCTTASKTVVRRLVMGRAYIEIPGSKTHELPPLLVRSAPEGTDLATVMDRASQLVESEEMLPEMADPPETERRKYDLAVNLTQQYLRLLAHWQWGESILEWIR